MTRLGVLPLVFTTLWISDQAWACSLCDSERAREVRAGVFDESFGRHVAAAVAPFALLAGLIGAVHFGGRSFSQQDVASEARR